MLNVIILNLIHVAFRMQMCLMRLDYVNENGLALCETFECVLFGSRGSRALCTFLFPLFNKR